MIQRTKHNTNPEPTSQEDVPQVCPHAGKDALLLFLGFWLFALGLIALQIQELVHG